MGLQFEIDTLDGVDDAVKGLYKENNGKYSLDVDLGDQFVPSSEVAGLKQNHDKLLAEKKAAQAKALEAEAEARKIAEQKALDNKDVESLTKSWAEKEKSYQQKLAEYDQKEARRHTSTAANDLAISLADGANIKLLSHFIESRLKYDNGNVKVVDKDGNLTVSTIEDLKKEFETCGDYDSLLRGSKASGSGASKANGGAGGKTITREGFDSMSQKERHEFVKSGGKVA